MKPIRHSALPGIAAAAVLHGGLLLFLFLADPPETKAAVRKPPVRVRVIERRPPRPAPPPEAEVEPEAMPELKPKPEKKKRRKPRKAIERPALVKELPPEPPAPAPASVAPEAKAEPASAPTPTQIRKPRRFSVAMSATVGSGGVAVPTTTSGGGWAFGSTDGDPDGERALAGPAPTGDGSGGGILPVGATAVTALPRLLTQPSFREMRELYPETARADGLEADVSLKILVSTRGEVVNVRVLRRAGQGFDEAAEKLVRRFRFAPGRRGDEPVPVWIPWTYRFRLEG